jgi:type VII secretion integral membrane protein EccD
MSATFDSELRRVSVHADAAVLDLSLPAAVPVATLIPSIVDILDGRAPAGDVVATGFQLSRPGLPALPASTTLAENAIPDGAVLILSRSSPEPPALRHHDTAEAMSAELGATDLPGNRHAGRLFGAIAASIFTAAGLLALARNALNPNIAGATAGAAALAGLGAVLFATIAHRARRDPITGLTLCLIATAFAAVAGLLAVPGPLGAPNVLLAATAAATTAVLAIRVTGRGVTTLRAVTCFVGVAAVAALAGMVTAAPLHAIASVCVLGSVGLLEISPRMSLVLARLSPTRPREDRLTSKAIHADKLLTSLFAGFAWSAAVGAMVTDRVVFSTVTGALLLLRARSLDRTRMIVFSSSGTVTIATTFAVAATAAPRHGPAIVAVTATLAVAAIYLGSATSLSPVGRRGIELVECVALVTMVPLTCWVCGLFTAVRGLSPL